MFKVEDGIPQLLEHLTQALYQVQPIEVKP
jgi:hypothetical protein